MVAQLVPNIAYVTNRSDRREGRKSYYDGSTDGRWLDLSLGYKGEANPWTRTAVSEVPRLAHLDTYPHAFQLGGYRRKALSSVKPHEDLEPVEHDHPFRRLVENPNPFDTWFDFAYERQMFLELCGVAYTWCVPNAWGEPCELWVIPSHWVWPRTGGGKYVPPDNPHADELIQFYEVRPWGGLGSAGILRFPPNEIVMERWKSPVNKIDGYSKLSAASFTIDTEESVQKSRWAQMQNQAIPSCYVELTPDFSDPDDARIARLEAKFMSKLQGEFNVGRPFFGPPGMKITPISFNPEQMTYVQTEEQVRDQILSTLQVPGAAVGLVREMTYGSVLATLASFCSGAIDPRLTMMGQTWTKHLAPKFTRHRKDDRREIRIWHDSCIPHDPSQINADIQTDLQCLLPGQELQGVVTGASKARYSGEAVEIRTRSGAVLRVTPNHPVLTEMGFVPAGQLQESQHLIRYIGGRRVASEDDVENAPASVEEVFDALRRFDDVPPAEVACAGVEFHGDARRFEGEVQVVGSYRQLRRGRPARPAKGGGEGAFVGFGVHTISLADPRVRGLVGFRELTPPPGGGQVGAVLVGERAASEGHGDPHPADLSTPFGGQSVPPFAADGPEVVTHPGVRLSDFRTIHGESCRLGSVADRDAGLFEALPQPHVADAQFGGDLLDRQAGVVEVDAQAHVRRRLGVEQPLRFGPAADLDVPRQERGLNGVHTDPQLAGQLCDRFPGFVTSDQIVEIRKFHYSGSVYDFESPHGYIVTNSIIVSNCLAITPNEVRALRGRKPYRYGGNDPIGSGPGGQIPIPFNTGEDLGEFAGLIEPMAQMGQQGGGQEGGPGGPPGLPAPGQSFEELAAQGGGELGGQGGEIAQGEGSMNPQVAEANTEPSKGTNGVVHKRARAEEIGPPPTPRIRLPKFHEEMGWECGPDCLASVLQYFGVLKVPLDRFFDLVGADPEDGTPPKRMVGILRRFGVRAEPRDGMALDDLRAALDAGAPVICCMQAWGTPSRYPQEESGHWVVAVDHDARRLYFEDPMLRGVLGDLSPAEFVERWHDQDGRGNRYVRFGIVCWRPEKSKPIKGKKSAEPDPELERDRELRRVWREARHRKESPDYGTLWFHPERQDVWYVTADGDSREFTRWLQAELESVPLIRDVRLEAESSPKDEGWVQLYPTLEKRYVAKTPGPHRYGSTQVDLPPDLRRAVAAWTKATVPQEELAEDGVEEDGHVTALYGLTNYGDEDDQAGRYKPATYPNTVDGDNYRVP